MSKGKQPRTRVNKVPKLFLSEKKVVIIKYNQEIGLEAAIFLRTRNRALVSDISTENLTDLKQNTDTLSIVNFLTRGIYIPFYFNILRYCLSIIYGVAEHWVNRIKNRCFCTIKKRSPFNL